ncbi:MAG TPA: glycosyltransferase family 2 protein [Acidimicrobiales bacterium]
MTAAVIVVNWNDTSASIRALRSARAKSQLLRILVDNGSATDPRPEVLARCPGSVVERLPANRGYAAACNRGIEIAATRGASHVLIMNNDAELARDALDELMAADTEIPGRVLAPLIVYSDAPDRIWSAGGYVEPPYLRNHHIGLGESLESHRTRKRVQWATGCSLWFSVDIWRRLGPLDEAFFLYLEDVDWCLRAAEAGVETWFVPEAVVRHDVSRTTGGLSPVVLRYYAYRNHFRLAFRHARGVGRLVIAFELVWTAIKIGLRSFGSSSYRHDPWYHARTRALRDFLLGHWGPAPMTVGGVAT